MKIKQFEDKPLAHYSYAILSECAAEIILIDPSRDITPYLEYAQEHGAKISGVIETHPHADFISSHLELYNTLGAIIYASRLTGAEYPHQAFDDGDRIQFGKITLRALNTPGHSPDSISVVLEHDGKDKAVFTGDTLFIGDCGRPDLREHTGNLTAAREELARQMYHSLRERLMLLDDDTIVYPAHGAGTLCGKALSDANSSTIGAEKVSNWSLQAYTEAAFVQELIKDQPFVPKYFPYDVTINRRGADNLSDSLARIAVSDTPGELIAGTVIVDTRPQADFKKGHLHGSINIQDGGKFETWLGSIINPGESFYLAAAGKNKCSELLARVAKIGYEGYVLEAFVGVGGLEKMDGLDVEAFRRDPTAYTIVNVRDASEVVDRQLFAGAINIPLSQLRERVGEIPAGKPVVVHCAGGYRSAAGSSIVQDALDGKTPVYDLGEAVKTF